MQEKTNGCVQHLFLFSSVNVVIKELGIRDWKFLNRYILWNFERLTTRTPMSLLKESIPELSEFIRTKTLMKNLRKNANRKLRRTYLKFIVSFPGNLEELKNLIEHKIITSPFEVIDDKKRTLMHYVCFFENLEYRNFFNETYNRMDRKEKSKKDVYGLIPSDYSSDYFFQNNFDILGDEKLFHEIFENKLVGGDYGEEIMMEKKFLSMELVEQWKYISGGLTQIKDWLDSSDLQGMRFLRNLRSFLDLYGYEILVLHPKRRQQSPIFGIFNPMLIVMTLMDIVMDERRFPIYTANAKEETFKTIMKYLEFQHILEASDRVDSQTTKVYVSTKESLIQSVKKLKKIILPKDTDEDVQMRTLNFHACAIIELLKRVSSRNEEPYPIAPLLLSAAKMGIGGLKIFDITGNISSLGTGVINLGIAGGMTAVTGVPDLAIILSGSISILKGLTIGDFGATALGQIKEGLGLIGMGSNAINFFLKERKSKSSWLGLYLNARQAYYCAVAVTEEKSDEEAEKAFRMFEEILLSVATRKEFLIFPRKKKWLLSAVLLMIPEMAKFARHKKIRNLVLENLGDVKDRYEKKTAEASRGGIKRKIKNVGYTLSRVATFLGD